ncbi:hypothetical protein N8J89_03795 [Crossiella sp. CA-258035]|uniref:class II glutamine amidotransferase n=1 Tax=Crossiella sp. CA-258035 TaxID=2981138 RepID=UPI0024BD34B6|nr:hypothetical protein [Crossiella sp. CA-258035]WHT20207.1 hypothetical protein N8J89_03795 [Crossiella sp. CA-258035]
MGAFNNPDGHGFAIVQDGQIVVRRGMDPDELIEDFTKIRAEHPDGPALFHSRFATHGDIGEANCHPFEVGGDPRTVLAHNGILPANVQPKFGDRRSDTRIAATEFLPRNPFGSLTLRRSRRRLADWMTALNKFVILTVDARYRRQYYIINEKSGIWDGGSWYSNDGYLRPQWSAQMAHSPDVPGFDDYECECCFEVGSIDVRTGVCLVCECCCECGEYYRFCGCPWPEQWDASPVEPPMTLDLDLVTGA